MICVKLSGEFHDETEEYRCWRGTGEEAQGSVNPVSSYAEGKRIGERGSCGRWNTGEE